MSVRSKVMWLVLGVSLAFAFIAQLVQRQTVLPAFRHIELEQARADVDRARHALEHDAEFLASAATDYGAWDDTYRFVDERDEEYITENLIPETFKNLHVNLLAIIDKDGEVVWAELREGGGGELIDAPEVLSEITQADSALTRHASPESTASGVVRTPRGVLLAGSSPITTSDRNGEVRGAIIMARFVDDALVEELSRRTHVTLAVRPVADAAETSPPPDAIVDAQRRCWTSDADRRVLRSYAPIADVFGQPALLIATELPREVSRRAETTLATALGGNIAFGLALTLVLWWALARMMIEPLSRVTEHAVRVGATDNLEARLNATGRDEIAVLSREFDRMVDRLADSRRQMLDVAHRAGKAQVAIDVLHNVGNVLSSVTVSTAELRDKLKSSEVPTVSKAAQLLQANERDLGAFMSSDERGKQLPGFLAELGEHLVREQSAMLNEVSTLAEAVEHIRAIVQSQQSQAGAARLLERIRPERLVADAVALSADSMSRHSIRVECTNDCAGDELLDRHRILQILVNVLTNAKQAIKDSGRDDRRIEIHTQRRVEDGAPLLSISVADNGVGIAGEDLERIFAMGFTTKSHGTGVGLPSAANLALEMGGTLVARSDGPGRGAVFTLTIPLQKQEAAA